MAARRERNVAARWDLTREAFDALLARLDSDRERAGEKYESARQVLIEFFEARGCQPAAEYADEALNRVARKIAEGEEVRDVRKYLYGVARLLLLEFSRGSVRESVSLDSALPALAVVGRDEEGERRRDERESRLACLEACMKSLPAESREFIAEYYREERGLRIEPRRELARRLGITLRALRLRAYRIRARLDDCVRDCLNRRATK
jgi:DNA-directed RNA polymerase specialized sigma24 family protein